MNYAFTLLGSGVGLSAMGNVDPQQKSVNIILTDPVCRGAVEGDMS